MKTNSNILSKYTSKRALWIMIIWVLVSNFLFIYDHASLAYAKAIQPDYNFWGNYLNYIVITIVVGIIGGVYTINMMESWLQKHPFWKALLFIILKFILIGGVISCVGTASFVTIDTKLSFFSSEVWSQAFDLLQTWPYVKTISQWFFIIIVTLVVVKFKYIDS